MSNSVGVRAGEPDPFAAAVMDEIGIDLSRHVPKSLDHAQGRLVRSDREPLAGSASQGAALAQGFAVDVEYWPTPDPSLAEGSREQILECLSDFA